MRRGMGNDVARVAARVLAGALVVGAVLSAVTGDGLARVVGAVTGYADFGYVPEHCAAPSRTARAIDGSNVRVCQDVYNTTYGFFAGHDVSGLDWSYADLHLSLPDQAAVFSCCNEDEGAWARFAPPTFDDVVANRGTMHTKGGALVEVAQTSLPTASGYAVLYSIKNVSGRA